MAKIGRLRGVDDDRRTHLIAIGWDCRNPRANPVRSADHRQKDAISEVARACI